MGGFGFGCGIWFFGFLGLIFVFFWGFLGLGLVFVFFGFLGLIFVFFFGFGFGVCFFFGYGVVFVFFVFLGLDLGFGRDPDPNPSLFWVTRLHVSEKTCWFEISKTNFRAHILKTIYMSENMHIHA